MENKKAEPKETFNSTAKERRRRICLRTGDHRSNGRKVHVATSIGMEGRKREARG